MDKEKQTVLLEQRESLKISGVMDVDAFDENGILQRSSVSQNTVDGQPYAGTGGRYSSRACI